VKAEMAVLTIHAKGGCHLYAGAGLAGNSGAGLTFQLLGSGNRNIAAGLDDRIATGVG